MIPNKEDTDIPEISAEETKLASEQQILKEKLGMVTSKAMQYKNHFEELAKEHFGKDVEVELR